MKNGILYTCRMRWTVAGHGSKYTAAQNCCERRRCRISHFCAMRERHTPDVMWWSPADERNILPVRCERASWRGSSVVKASETEERKRRAHHSQRAEPAHSRSDSETPSRLSRTCAGVSCARNACSGRPCPRNAPFNYPEIVIERSAHTPDSNWKHNRISNRDIFFNFTQRFEEDYYITTRFVLGRFPHVGQMITHRTTVNSTLVLVQCYKRKIASIVDYL